MAFEFGALRDDVSAHIDGMVEEWATLQAEWGLTNGDLALDNVNSLCIWDNLQVYGEVCQAAIAIKEARESTGVRNRRQEQSFNLPFPFPYQLPLVPATEFSFALKDEPEPCPQHVYAIDGGDQVAYEFTQGRKGGAGIATYGWVVTQDGSEIETFPKRRRLQLVPANIRDLENFSLLNFNQRFKNLSSASISVREFAARRRTQLEFLTLNYLVDQAEPGSIILLDGFLKAMYTPPTSFVHEIGKKASRKAVILLGVAKRTKIDMWLHFEEFWKNGRTSSGWIRPPAPILDQAYRSISGEDTNQYLYLGEKGRGIGIPIAVTLSALPRSYYVVDFNCYDFEAGRPYLRATELPEVHAKYFPLTTKDKDFISIVLAQLAYYSNQLTCLGYPFPAATAHRLVKITHYDIKKVRSLAQSELLSKGIQLRDMEPENPPKILEF
jgi:hypothetical protein